MIKLPDDATPFPSQPGCSPWFLGIGLLFTFRKEVKQAFHFVNSPKYVAAYYYQAWELACEFGRKHHTRITQPQESPRLEFHPQSAFYQTPYELVYSNHVNGAKGGNPRFEGVNMKKKKS